MATKSETNPVDPASLEKIAAETAALLAEAPPPLKAVADEAASVAAANYTPPDDPQEPEDFTALMEQAFSAIGRPVPAELLQAVRVKQQPVRADEQGRPDGPLSPEQEAERQRRVQDRYQDALGRVASRGSEKRQNYIDALRQSPRVAYFNRKDRWLIINRVKIEVPEGEVTIPAMIAREIERIDATEQWAERERRRAMEFSSIERQPTSFVEKRVRGFAIS